MKEYEKNRRTDLPPLLDPLRELVAIESISGTPAVTEALHRALDICGRMGFRTKNCEDRLGYAEIGDGKELIGILCHLDVVPTGDGWVHPPFACQVEEGKVYGRGVMDDKGPAVAAIYAMKDLLDQAKAEGRTLDKRIRILFGTMEETGEWEDMDWYAAHEELPSYGFTPDADFPAIYGEKGILLAELSMDLARSGFQSVSGGEAPNMVADWAEGVLTDGRRIRTAGKAAHGSTPEEGENAITKLMERAALAEGPLAPAEGQAAPAAFAQAYMEKIGWSLDGSKCGLGFSDEASGGLTFNAGAISVEDGLVKLKVDIRYPVTYTQEAVLDALTASMAEVGIDVKVITGMKPVYMDKDGPVITRLMEAYRQVTGDARPAQVMGGGTYARAMNRIVAFGPVFPGRECTEHQKDEYIYLEDLEKARQIYRLALEKLLSWQEQA